MAALRNYNIGKNVNFTINPFCKSLEKIYKQHRTWNTKFNRLLATYERQRELKQTMLREKLPEKRSYKEKINMSSNISAYSHVKKNDTNNIDVYMKNYKRRYGKKKGLSKLDCYYENKVFRKINHICDIAEKVQYNEKRAKKIFLKKYGTVLIFSSLIPVLGFIFPILFGDQDLGGGIIDYCLREKHVGGPKYCNCGRKYQWYVYKTPIKIMGYFSYIIFSSFAVIVSLIFIYILIKVIKYERLKAGEGKMSLKEYGCFAKDVFI
ncbi:Plasmodium exported protein, unknown function [Plasmodium vivax]|uniref:Variable surface protein Vir35 n=1 Tax=Plasmodium vivax TaxID=5855 RepID=A0A565A554_PLAVI|nr:Plasmodium exported protein, unknown function [Plasmodium vivax]